MPAASSWGLVLNQRLAADKKPAMAPAGTSVMQAPLVIAMPKPMAEALGWPNTPIGYSDILALATNPDGWASKGHPEWGSFKLGKTNPNYSTSGLSSLVAEYYAATNKTSGLTLEDLTQPAVDTFARGVESAVVHYGDTTLTFMCNLYNADRRGATYSYASAISVEENSVISYNQGNCDGNQAPPFTPPKVPLVAVYPKEGTLFSDNPFIVLDASWVSKAERDAAAVFGTFVQQPANQRLALKYGFRPGSSTVPLGAPIDAAHGVDPAQPQTTLVLPSGPVLAGLIDRWIVIRKAARVVMVIDVSGSMGDEADPKTGDDQARARPEGGDLVARPVPCRRRAGAVGVHRRRRARQSLQLPRRRAQRTAREQPEKLQSQISSLQPDSGTPLYPTTRNAFDFVKSEFDPQRINAVVLLTDGQDTSADSFAALVQYLQQQTVEDPGHPVHIFTIGYGQSVDANKLTLIAQATNGHYYSATDPKTIVDVLNAVVSNF